MFTGSPGMLSLVFEQAFIIAMSSLAVQEERIVTDHGSGLGSRVYELYGEPKEMCLGL